MLKFQRFLHEAEISALPQVAVAFEKNAWLEIILLG